MSPLQYQRALRAASVRRALKQGEPVASAIYSAGFGSSSRGYEGAQLGMTPARFAAGGRGERIGWCAARTPFGWVIVGATARGLCWLALAGTKAEAEASLRAEFPAATITRDPSLGAMVECGDPLRTNSLKLPGRSPSFKSNDTHASVATAVPARRCRSCN